MTNTNTSNCLDIFLKKISSKIQHVRAHGIKYTTPLHTHFICVHPSRTWLGAHEVAKVAFTKDYLPS